MTTQKISLNDRFDLDKSPVLLNGTQALVRLTMMQAARDKAAGLNTAGYVTGYRGSPLGAVDLQMSRAEKQLTAHQITFQPGLNEDLAATALWGAQQAELRGEGKYDGVFGLWYGKGPGVDRSGDVMRHANMAGTSVYGGVLMAMGDDHTGESSTVLAPIGMGDGGCLHACRVSPLACRKFWITASTAGPCRVFRPLGRAQDDERHGGGDVSRGW